jgi:uncharacterized membrane protein
MIAKLLIYLFVYGLFVAAAFLIFVEDRFQRDAGMLLVLSGALAVVFCRVMAEVQELIASRFGLQRWFRIRPLTFVLWGVGVVIVGLAWLQMQ